MNLIEEKLQKVSETNTFTRKSLSSNKKHSPLQGCSATDPNSTEFLVAATSQNPES